MLERPRLTAAPLARRWTDPMVSAGGDQETGVGVMAMEEGLDTGPVLLERNLPIGLLDNAQQVGERLSTLTAELMVEAMPLIEAAGPGPEPERLERLGVRPKVRTTAMPACSTKLTTSLTGRPLPRPSTAR